MAAFDTEISNSKAGALVSGIDKYRQFLHNFIETRVYDRWFSGFGIDLDDSVFDIYSEQDLEFSLITKLENAVEKYIPEIKINYSCSSVSVDREGNIMKIVIVFEYKGERYSEEVEVRV